MPLAAVQYRPDRQDGRASLAGLTRWAEQAAQRSKLVVLPEMAASGYIFPDRDAVEAVAEPARGPTFEALAPVAREQDCWIIVGFPELDGERLFNSALVIDPKGGLAFTYRKTLLFDADMHWATPGDSGYRRFDTDFGSFGVGICMDLNDDRFLSWCARARLDIIALPTCWVDEEYEVWPYWMARMAGLRSTLVAANTWGEQGGVRFSGASAVLRRGRILAGAPKAGDAAVVV